MSASGCFFIAHLTDPSRQKALVVRYDENVRTNVTTVFISQTESFLILEGKKHWWLGTMKMSGCVSQLCV